MREQRRAKNICGTRRRLGPRVRQVGTEKTRNRGVGKARHMEFDLKNVWT
jgi:hypothetical protein